MKKSDKKKNVISIAIDLKINQLLDEKSINKSKLVNTLIKNSSKEDMLKFVK